MEENNKVNDMAVPYIAFESVQAKSERVTKRLTAALIIAIILMFLSNVLWLNAWLSYDYVSEDETETETITLDAGSGNANYIGQDGDITNGENNGK